MIAPAYIRLMARYNSEMNRRVYAAAARLTDERRRAGVGLFWGSPHGTPCHQTHHRGQVHAALTMHGANPGDTDLFLVVPGA